jgi:hypothetical protein
MTEADDTQVVPIDNRPLSDSLLALHITGAKGADAVKVCAMSRRNKDHPWHLTSGLNIPSQHPVWEALLADFERTVAQ